MPGQDPCPLGLLLLLLGGAAAVPRDCALVWRNLSSVLPDDSTAWLTEPSVALPVDGAAVGVATATVALGDRGTCARARGGSAAAGPLCATHLRAHGRSLQLEFAYDPSSCTATALRLAGEGHAPAAFRAFGTVLAFGRETVGFTALERALPATHDGPHLRVWGAAGPRAHASDGEKAGARPRAESAVMILRGAASAPLATLAPLATDAAFGRLTHSQLTEAMRTCVLLEEGRRCARACAGLRDDSTLWCGGAADGAADGAAGGAAGAAGGGVARGAAGGAAGGCAAARVQQVCDVSPVGGDPTMPDAPGAHHHHHHAPAAAAALAAEPRSTETVDSVTGQHWAQRTAQRDPLRLVEPAWAPFNWRAWTVVAQLHDAPAETAAGAPAAGAPSPVTSLVTCRLRLDGGVLAKMRANAWSDGWRCIECQQIGIAPATEMLFAVRRAAAASAQRRAAALGGADADGAPPPSVSVTLAHAPLVPWTVGPAGGAAVPSILGALEIRTLARARRRRPSNGASADGSGGGGGGDVGGLDGEAGGVRDVEVRLAMLENAPPFALRAVSAPIALGGMAVPADSAAPALGGCGPAAAASAVAGVCSLRAASVHGVDFAAKDGRLELLLTYAAGAEGAARALSLAEADVAALFAHADAIWL